MQLFDKRDSIKLLLAGQKPAEVEFLLKHILVYRNSCMLCNERMKVA